VRCRICASAPHPGRRRVSHDRDVAPASPGLAGPGWSFLPFIFGAADAGGRQDQLRAARSTTAMACHRRQDQIVQEGTQS
jgi:hypothetical protein